MNVLNLYSGIGGNRKLWTDVEVTAVEYNEEIANIYREQFPLDKMVIGDAHQYLLDHFNEFDFIWSSLPCQKHSKMNKFTRHNMVRYVDGALFEEIIFLDTYFKGKWVVENVVPYYKPYGNPIRIGRHLFWSNFTIYPMDPPKSPDDMINLATVGKKKIMMDWLGIHFAKNIYYENNHCPVQILRNAVHPELGKHIFECSLKGEIQASFIF